jgi:hypothetical protein
MSCCNLAKIELIEAKNIGKLDKSYDEDDQIKDNVFQKA